VALPNKTTQVLGGICPGVATLLSHLIREFAVACICL